MMWIDVCRPQKTPGVSWFFPDSFHECEILEYQLACWEKISCFFLMSAHLDLLSPLKLWLDTGVLNPLIWWGLGQPVNWRTMWSNLFKVYLMLMCYKYLACSRVMFQWMSMGSAAPYAQLLSMDQYGPTHCLLIDSIVSSFDWLYLNWNEQKIIVSML